MLSKDDSVAVSLVERSILSLTQHIKRMKSCQTKQVNLMFKGRMTRRVDLLGVRPIYLSDTLHAFRNRDSMSFEERGLFPIEFFWGPRKKNVFPIPINNL